MHVNAANAKAAYLKDSYTKVADTALAQAAKSKKFERCVFLYGRIERLTKLRRAGGTAMRMERWRQSRERYAEESRTLRCHRFGRKLRKAGQSKSA